MDEKSRLGDGVVLGLNEKYVKRNEPEYIRQNSADKPSFFVSQSSQSLSTESVARNDSIIRMDFGVLNNAKAGQNQSQARNSTKVE